MSPEKLSPGKEQLHFSLENSIIRGAYCKFHLFSGFYSKCGLSMPTWSCQILGPLPGLRQAHRFLHLLPVSWGWLCLYCSMPHLFLPQCFKWGCQYHCTKAHGSPGNWQSHPSWAPLHRGDWIAMVRYTRGEKKPRVTALFRAAFPKTCSTE